MKQNQDWGWWAALVGCLLLAGLRFFQPHTPPSGPGTYQAVAHLFVGLLFGAWLGVGPMTVSGRRWLWLGLALTVIEGVAFVVTLGKG